MIDKNELLNAYLKELKVKGMKTAKVLYSTKIFFKYIDEYSIDYLRLKIHEAQAFQTYIMTLTNDEGNVKYGKGTVTNVVGCLRTFYRYLKKKKVILSNPFNEIKRVKRNKNLPKNILKEEKMIRLLNYLKDFGKGGNLIERKKLYKAHVICELMYSTGMRINEVMSLKPEDIDFANGTVKVFDSKTKRERDCILNEYALRVLKVYVDKMKDYIIFGKNNGDPSLLFGTATNLGMWLSDLFKQIFEKFDYNITFTSHSFRHAVGCHLLRSGCDMRYIQEILGHKELRTTQIYTKVEKNDLKTVLDNFHPRYFRSSK